MATLKDIAQRAQVSTATVSLALSGKGRVSEEMRAKVFSIAQELGYQYRKAIPKSHKSAVMLLPVSNTWGHVWHFLKDIIDYIQSEMTARGYTSLILPVLADQPVAELLEIIGKTGADAVYSIHHGDQKLFAALTTQNIPLVVVNNSEYQRDYWSVCVDDFSGSYEALQVLQEYGHKKIAYFDYPRPSLPLIFNDRYNGFRSAMHDKRLDVPDRWRVTTPLEKPEELINAIDRLIFQPDRPTAFFIHDDFLACRIHHILTSKGIRIPEDISLLSPGDTIDYSQPESPKISTMRINTNLMGKYAVDLMMSRIQDEETGSAPHVLKIRQQLEDRGSIARIL